VETLGKIVIVIDDTVCENGFPTQINYIDLSKNDIISSVGLVGQTDTERIEAEFISILRYLRNLKTKHLCALVEQERKKIKESIKCLQNHGATVLGMDLDGVYAIYEKRKP
jgi:hypothetical protein